MPIIHHHNVEIRERLTAERSSKYTERIVNNLRDQSSRLESSISTAHNSLSETQRQMSEVGQLGIVLISSFQLAFDSFGLRDAVSWYSRCELTQQSHFQSIAIFYCIPLQAELALRAEEALEKSLKVEIDAMAKDADRLDGLVARAQAAIDKRQNVIELRQQQLADLGGLCRQ